MKRFLFSLLMATTLSQTISAQWAQQTSGTTNNLRDVAFYNASIGYAVGDGGTVLRTNNGGNKWTLLTPPDKSDVVSVTVVDSNAVMVTTSSINGNAAVYESVNGGRSWRRTWSDLISLYATATPGRQLYSVGTQLYNSSNYGKNWTAQQNLSRTSTYTQLSFNDNRTGIAAGNISGAFTYSASFWRTVDGKTWYNGDNFSFPNANGFSCFDAIEKDSVMMFTNYYNRFSPGDSSQLILINNFKLQNQFGTKYWFFDNKILVQSFPDRITDCKFFSGGNGYAVSESGAVYKIKAGSNFNKEYNSRTALRGLYMTDANNGFAVGDNGLILKRNSKQITKTPAAVQVPLLVYPNPAANYTTVSFTLNTAVRLQLQITNDNGNIVFVQTARAFEKGKQSVSLAVTNLPRGHYRVNLIDEKNEVTGTAQLMVAH